MSEWVSRRERDTLSGMKGAAVTQHSAATTTAGRRINQLLAERGQNEERGIVFLDPQL